MMQYSQHHHGHTPYQWAFAMDLMSLGFSFLNDQERERCHKGETSIMEINIHRQTMGFNIDGHDGGLTLQVYHEE